MPPASAVRKAEELLPEPGNPSVQIRQINEAVLFEMSTVTRPAYQETALDVRSEELLIPRKVYWWAVTILTLLTLATAIGSDSTTATRLLPRSLQRWSPANFTGLAPDAHTAMKRCIRCSGMAVFNHPSQTASLSNQGWRSQRRGSLQRFDAVSVEVLRGGKPLVLLQATQSRVSMSWFWPFGKLETRSGGGYTDAIVRAIEAQSAATVADVSSTSAIEAVAGLMSRTLSSAKVDGPSWLQEAIDPPWLAMVGRSLIREGASLSVIRATEGGLHLVPAAHWTFETLDGQMLGEIEDEWQARITTYGPSASTTRTLAREEFVYVRWGASPGTPYRGRGPTSWAQSHREDEWRDGTLPWRRSERAYRADAQHPVRWR